MAGSSSPEGSGSALAERSSATEARGSINLRIEAGTRRLIDEAAAILGKTRTEFMIESARREAMDVLLDRRFFALDPARYDAFLDALDNPPAPGPKLRSLLRRVPAWEK
ncbi:DUF1778 domain-containing protein [Enterovirga aerilata]|uniref:DUF1778 domain-containing protein n=1 Tax=Enterovirga aerilata TaxID=2730920 RepID=A0A849HYL5_9HYPH|nr:DUF1778 domain-containing protein [Enterovirga sp. DB1703]NNM72202.1 DUF1778 domain-containing protein [Enterovirga sp. DB1703]